MAEKPKRPRDANQLAKVIVDIATGEGNNLPEAGKPEAQRKGGLAGGRARAEKLDPARRVEIAKKAAEQRWRGSASVKGHKPVVRSDHDS